MQDDQRKRLTERRTLLNRRMARGHEARHFRRIAPSLCGQEVSFSRVPAIACQPALKDVVILPGRDERLDWAFISGGICNRYDTVAERDRLVGDALTACADDDERALVVFHPAESGLKIDVGDLRRHAALVLDDCPESIWIVAAEGGSWIVEIAYWDRDVCYSAAYGLKTD